MNFLISIIYGLILVLVCNIITKYLIYSVNNDGNRYKHVRLNFIDIYRIMRKLSFIRISLTGNYHIYSDRTKPNKSDTNCTCLYINDNELFLEYKRLNDMGDVSYTEGYYIHTDIISYTIIQSIHKYNVYLLKLNKNKYINKSELPDI